MTFSGGIAADAGNPDGAQTLIDFLASAAAAPTIAETGPRAGGER